MGVIIPSDGTILPRFAWDNGLDYAQSLTASTEESGWPVANVADWRPSRQWRPTVLPATITVTWASARPVSAFCLFGHSLGTRSCSVQAEVYDGSWSNFESFVSPASTEVVYIYGDTVMASQARITITGSGDMPELGVLFVGADMISVRGLREGWQPPAGAQKKVTQNIVSYDGQWLGAVETDEYAEGPIVIPNVPEAWLISDWRPFRDRCQLQPFFFHWSTSIDPGGAAFCQSAKFGGLPYSAVGFAEASIQCRQDVR